ncbi:MAG: DUF4954 family protein [Chitinophagaceae bacterium]
MNHIVRHTLDSLGYQFVPEQYLPEGKNEYHLRNLQNGGNAGYRQLNAQEIEILVRNRNQSDNWNNIFVSEAFNPELVKNCKFFGLIRIGKLEPFYLEFHNLRMPVGLYNSIIISCDIGDNAVIDNVNYLAHYIIGNEVMIMNVNEMTTSSTAKFGNGIVKDGEEEQIRIFLELCNENGGRSVIPFNGMLPGDAYLWSKFRADKKLLERFKVFTEDRFDKQRGYYGKVGDRSIIKNTNMIKDVWIGSDAYIKGANKLKNLTINSIPKASTQIGEGCELVNGIIGYGCRIFYGVKAVRFVMASHSQLKYGARLINSYLGNNATISCCEVLNSLIFPAHEQHHNNSFLCAALIMGQSNMAAGATIGSNHNSRGADGEIVAGRGFWPGLCVSLKHNSRFPSFTIMAKGDYPAELDIKIPFSLVSNNVSKDKLVVMPGYWFLYNMYALARNAWKSADRDKRIEKIQSLEYGYLAPDSVQEMAEGLKIMELAMGKAFLEQVAGKTDTTEKQAREAGLSLLLKDDPQIDTLTVTVSGWENTNRIVQLVKVRKAWVVFRKMIVFHAVNALYDICPTSPEGFEAFVQERSSKKWHNVGGQLMPEETLKELISAIKSKRINSWADVHAFYATQSAVYNRQKCAHAWSVYFSVFRKKARDFTIEDLAALAAEAISTREWIADAIYASREKDYNNPFRNMLYDSAAERDEVIGSLEENSFIQLEQEELKKYRKKMRQWLKKIKIPA